MEISALLDMRGNRTKGHYSMLVSRAKASNFRGYGCFSKARKISSSSSRVIVAAIAFPMATSTAKWNECHETECYSIRVLLYQCAI